MPARKRIAYWMSEKKSQKTNFKEFSDVCSKHGFELFKLNLEESLESQEPFCVFLHKLTDVIASAKQGDPKNSAIINKIEKYIENNPSLVVIDPILNVRKLLDRFEAYSIISSINLQDHGIFTPTFCEIGSYKPESQMEELKKAKVSFPFICKAVLGHGSPHSHEMSIIFNENCLKDCTVPCVVQSFVNHNAVLYKLFVVGDQYMYVDRPSLKNFNSCDRETIFFETSDVSKADSQSHLNILDPEDAEKDLLKPEDRKFALIATRLSAAFGMDLLGIDIVIENNTGKYAIIDVNAYPGYDKFPNFFEKLVTHIEKKLT